MDQTFAFSSDCNANLSIRIRDALNTIAGADVFHEIQSALPLGFTSTDSDAGTGVQAPFAKTSYQTSMRTHNTYTCGCNLFWCRFDFSPNPGVPIRMTAIEQLIEFYFAKPGPMPRPVVITINDLGADPLTQRGALRAISPEEIRCAMLFAIARDVARDAPLEDLKAWRCHVLSTTTQFVYHATNDDMYFAACQLRENMGQDHDSMYRTALQRVYEIARFRESQLKVHGPAAGTAQAVFRAYERAKTAGKQQPYSLAAIDSSLTIMARLLSIPSVQTRLLDADAWNRGDNPFDSVYKLEAILRKGKDASGITWLVDMLWYVVQHKSKPIDSEDLSLCGLRGKKTNGNRGYLDVLLFKKDCIPYLLDNLPRELGLDPSWFTSTARTKMETVVAHLDATKDPSWCAGIDKHTMTFATFCQDFIYGLTYDGCIKALVKSNKQPANLAMQPGVTELLADIKNGVLELKKPLAGAETSESADAKGDGDVDGGDACLADCAITIRTKDSKQEDVKISQLSDDHKEKILRCRQFITHRVDACITLVSKSVTTNPDLGATLGNTAAGRYAGPLRVAVIYDTKLHGEAQHRPNIRLPPFQSDDCKVLLEAARDRSRTPHGDGAVPATDLYFLLDGGRDIASGLTAYFRGKETTSKSLHVIYEPESLLKRYSRVKGFMTHSSLETVKVVAASFPASLNTPRPRKYYGGTTALNAICNVPVPSRDDQWCLAWGDKKLVMAGSMIPVGGRATGADDDDDDPPARRTDATVEPVFFHSMSPHLWSELLYDFEVGAVIDLTAGDGAVAMAALRAGCAYTGVTLTDAHAVELRKHLHKTAFQAAATEGDELYDADLVLSLRGKSRKRMTLEDVDKLQAGGGTKTKKSKKGPQPDDDPSGGGGKKKAKAKVKAKGKAKPKGKAKSKAKETDPFKDGGSDLDPEDEDWTGSEEEDDEEEDEGDDDDE